MSNPVIERLEAERAEQEAFIDKLLAKVEDDGRDLVEAEEENLKAVKQRITRLDAQLEPLREYESLRAKSAGEAGRIFSGRSDTDRPERPLGMDGGGGIAYASPGAFLIDYIAARGNPAKNVAPDPAAVARLADMSRQVAAIQNQTTTDTPGLLPRPIVGPIVNTLDASRPLITSVGAKPLANIAGTGFDRPKITQHVQVGPQAAEKTEFPSRKMTIGKVPFTKGTYGGAVNVSRQDIDWTQPAAWDALTNDLARVYGAETELAAAIAFEAGITQSVDAADGTLQGWSTAIYEAAVKAFMGGAAAGAIPNGQLPSRIWCSLDMWASMGAIVDVARLSFPTNITGSLGSAAGITDFAGDMLNAPRTVVWGLPAGTIVVGSPPFFEFYEDQVGLLTAVEPKIFGVEVAYGGYTALGFVEELAFCKVNGPPVVPLATTTRSKASS